MTKHQCGECLNEYRCKDAYKSDFNPCFVEDLKGENNHGKSGDEESNSKGKEGEDSDL